MHTLVQQAQEGKILPVAMLHQARSFMSTLIWHQKPYIYDPPPQQGSGTHQQQPFHHRNETGREGGLASQHSVSPVGWLQHAGGPRKGLGGSL